MNKLTKGDCRENLYIYTRAELETIANALRIPIKREPPGKGNKSMAELCADIVKFTSPPKPSIIVPPRIEKTQEPPPIPVSKQKNAPKRKCQWTKNTSCRDTNGGGYSREELVELAESCGID